jgi:hypothetical protein
MSRRKHGTEEMSSLSGEVPGSDLDRVSRDGSTMGAAALNEGALLGWSAGDGARLGAGDGSTLSEGPLADAIALQETHRKRAEKAEAERDAIEALNKSLLAHNGELLRELGDKRAIKSEAERLRAWSDEIAIAFRAQVKETIERCAEEVDPFWPDAAKAIRALKPSEERK